MIQNESASSSSSSSSPSCKLNEWNTGNCTEIKLRGNYGADVAESSDGEGEDLQKQVDEVVVLPIQEVVASTDEQEHRESQLLQLYPVSKDLGQRSLAFVIIISFVLEGVAELLGDHPLVDPLGLKQADDGGLGAVEGHDILEEHPVEEEVEGSGSADGVEGGDDAGEVDGSPFGDVDFGDEDCEGENHAVEEEGEHVGDDLSHEEEAVDHVQLLVQRHFLRCQSFKINAMVDL